MKVTCWLLFHFSEDKKEGVVEGYETREAALLALRQKKLEPGWALHPIPVELTVNQEATDGKPV